MKKYFAMLLAGMMAFSLAACGGSSSASSSEPAAETEAEAPAEEAEAPAEEAEAPAEQTEAPAEEAEAPAEAAQTDAEVTTIEAGKLHMATNAAFPPYEMISDNGGYEGIDVEVATMIAEKLGLELVVDDMEFGSVITSVQSGKADIAMAGLTVTEERKQNVDFTASYATGVQVIIVPEDSDITSVDDIFAKLNAGEDVLIGCQEATTGAIYASGDFGDDHVTTYPNGATAVQALTQGKLDCVIIDNQPAINFVAANEGLKILDTEYVTEDYAIAISKDNEDLLNQINAALEELIADGTVQEILDKYIVAG